MNKMKFKLQNKEPLAMALVLFVCSFIIGILVSKLGSKLLLDGFDNLNRNYFNRITDMDIAYGDLFQYILVSNYKKFFIFWLLSITILAVPYMALSIAKQGFQVGFLLSALIMQYNFKGFVLMLVYIFPQGLIYIPIMLYCLKAGYDISFQIRTSNKEDGLHNFYMLRNYRKLIILLIIGIFVGAFIETFVGSFLLRKVLTLF